MSSDVDLRIWCDKFGSTSLYVMPNVKVIRPLVPTHLGRRWSGPLNQVAKVTDPSLEFTVALTLVRSVTTGNSTF